MNTVSDLSPSQVFLEAFRRYGAGIAVITLLKKDGSPSGFTATSLASLSASPPMATFNMSQTASSWPSIAVDTPVLVHMLSVENQALAEKMAGETSERFIGDHWSPGPDGLPLLHDTHAWLHARVVQIMEVDFSAAVAVRIVAGGLGSPAEALVYQGQGYRRSADIGKH